MGADSAAYCQSWDKNTVVITVENYGGEGIEEANVYVDDRLACQLKAIPPNSSDVCMASVGGNATAVYRVVAVTSSGKEMKDAGVCVMYEVPLAPRPVTD